MNEVNLKTHLSNLLVKATHKEKRIVRRKSGKIHLQNFNVGSAKEAAKKDQPASDTPPLDLGITPEQEKEIRRLQHDPEQRLSHEQAVLRATGKTFSELVDAAIAKKKKPKPTKIGRVTTGKKTYRVSDASGREIKPETYHYDEALFQKIKREAPGKGHEIRLTKKEAITILRHGTVALLSAGRNPRIEEDKALSDKEIEARTEKLHADLVTAGLKFEKVTGHYEGEEESFMVFVPEIKRDEVTALGTKYNQDSVIYSEAGKNELIFTTGENKGKKHEGSGFDEVPKAEDFFTEFNTPRGKFKFSLRFNFDILKARLIKAVMDKLSGGRADNRPDSDFDPEELARGTEHELEHTKDRALAEEIAKDHLAEDPLYYRHLSKMESLAKAWLIKAKNMGHLVSRIITNKLGRRQTVWVLPDLFEVHKSGHPGVAKAEAEHRIVGYVKEHPVMQVQKGLQLAIKRSGYSDQDKAYLLSKLDDAVGEYVVHSAPKAERKVEVGRADLKIVQKTSYQAEKGNKLLRIPLDKITAEAQIRKEFDPVKLHELANSIAESGLLQAVVVRPDPNKPGHYLMIAGERRLRAHRILQEEGRLTEPVIEAVVRDVDDREKDILQLVENFLRANNTALEVSDACVRLRDIRGMTTAEIAREIGKSPALVTGYLQLAKLTPDLRKLLEKGDKSMTRTAAMILAELPSATEQVRAYREMIVSNMTTNQLRAHVKSVMANRDTALFGEQEGMSAAQKAAGKELGGKDADKLAGQYSKFIQKHQKFLNKFLDKDGVKLSTIGTIAAGRYEAAARDLGQIQSELDRVMRMMRAEHDRLASAEGGGLFKAFLQESARWNMARALADYDMIKAAPGLTAVRVAIRGKNKTFQALRWKRLTDKIEPPPLEFKPVRYAEYSTAKIFNLEEDRAELIFKRDGDGLTVRVWAIDKDPATFKFKVFGEWGADPLADSRKVFMQDIEDSLGVDGGASVFTRLEAARLAYQEQRNKALYGDVKKIGMAKTVEEAQRQCKAVFGITADLRGMTLEQANAVNKTLLFESRFSSLDGIDQIRTTYSTFKSMGVTEENARKGEQESSFSATYGPVSVDLDGRQTGRIELNTALLAPLVGQTGRLLTREQMLKKLERLKIARSEVEAGAPKIELKPGVTWLDVEKDLARQHPAIARPSAGTLEEFLNLFGLDDYEEVGVKLKGIKVFRGSLDLLKEQITLLENRLSINVVPPHGREFNVGANQSSYWLSAVLIHEIGHHRHYQIKAKAMKSRAENAEERKKLFAQKDFLVAQAYDSAKWYDAHAGNVAPGGQLTTQSSAPFPSDYSTANDREFFAESYAAWRMGHILGRQYRLDNNLVQMFKDKVWEK